MSLDWIRSCLAKAMSIEWLGQSVASICWIASVLTYGIKSTGDQLQMLAASAWLSANVAAIVTVEKKNNEAGIRTNE